MEPDIDRHAEELRFIKQNPGYFATVKGLSRDGGVLYTTVEHRIDGKRISETIPTSGDLPQIGMIVFIDPKVVQGMEGTRIEFDLLSLGSFGERIK